MPLRDKKGLVCYFFASLHQRRDQKVADMVVTTPVDETTLRILV